MTILGLISEFFNVVTLVGIIILSRFAPRFWQIVLGVTLVILGLVSGGVIR